MSDVQAQNSSSWNHSQTHTSEIERRRRLSEEQPTTLKLVRREMRDAFLLDTRLLDKFFPVTVAPDPRYEKARGNLFNKRTNRWKGISAIPTPFSRIYRPLTKLLNGILYYSGIKRDARLFMDSHIRPCNSVISPGIFLSGVGSEFANSSEVLPALAFHNGISAIEVVMDSADMLAARDRLAANMHDIFQSQDNRRFAFGLLMTPNEFTLYMFDHSGAVASEPCNYHLHQDRFCAVISGLAAANGERIGFDNTIFGDGPETKIRTFLENDGESSVEVQYTIKETLFFFPSLIGRGTICWRTSRIDNPKTTFVIKDAWTPSSDPPGRGSEASLLQHARSRGITAGICQICHYEEVRHSDDPSDLDTVLRNRRDEGISPDVLKKEEELLLAFHDAVLAHRRLYDTAGILHRDISYRNILINPQGTEGNRGILIDFDHSIRVEDSSPYSKKTGIGTWRFRSRGVLRNHVPHTYFDDLESFYYVFCWILCSFEKVGVFKENLPNALDLWEHPTAYEMKTGHLLAHFKLPISSYFGTSLPSLARRLHEFFRRRLLSVKHDGEIFKQDPDKDYDEFISHIHQAVINLRAEERETCPGLPGLTVDGPDRKRPKRKYAVLEGEPNDSTTRSSLITDREGTYFGRPRRTKANYGYPPSRVEQ